jgi:hypothetical protein
MTDPTKPRPAPEGPLPGDPGGNPPPTRARTPIGHDPKPVPPDDGTLPGEPGPNPKPTIR